MKIDGSKKDLDLYTNAYNRTYTGPYMTASAAYGEEDLAEKERQRAQQLRALQREKERQRVEKERLKRVKEEIESERQRAQQLRALQQREKLFLKLRKND